MPSYPHRCLNCEHEFDVVKPVSEYKTDENCPKCDSSAERFIARTHFFGADDWNRQEYNPAFGEVLTPQQARKKARNCGMIEVGNEDPNKIHKHYDDDRAKRMEFNP